MSTDLDLAVVGMACRLPGANDLDEFWRNLRTGVESISFFTEAELIAAGVDRALLDNPNYVRAAPVLDDPSLFDAAFFGYSPSEARIIDPQHRLFLECAWTALEHAGYDPGRHDRPVGVYAGAAFNTYLLFSGLLPRFTDEYVRTLTGNDKDFLATRVSYRLDLTGPSMTVQTACSTSLVAVHLAAQSLDLGECDLALAGGVSVRVPHYVGYLHEEGGILSADGHCRPFDAAGGGTVFGSGTGVVVLKRLADALASGDTVHAVLKGSAVNNDGAAKVNYAAPSVTRQAAAVAEALANAGVDPATIGYVEAHGTGTRVGDPIEIEALTRAYREWTGKRGFCGIGSVKSNIGHLDAAAGVTGLIKTVLALKHAEIPASLHFTEPNPDIDFADTPFTVCGELTPWPPGPGPRRAAVNALGVGGTNAHVILEQAPDIAPSGPSRPWQLLVLSGKTPAALNAATAALAGELTARPPADLADATHTLRVGRHPLRHRRVVLCRDAADAGTRLRTLDPQWTYTGRCPAETPEVAFLLPGQGVQYPGMGLGLYRAEPVFRTAVDCCAELFAPELSVDLRELLGADEGRLAQNRYTQPALFTVEYALAELWSSWGLRPAALLGHSLGELTAACLAGVFSLEDAVRAVAARGRLMQELPPGAMLAVRLPEAEVLSYVDDDISLAAVNGPTQCVLAGPQPVIRDLAGRLRERKVATHHLRVSHAFHSTMTEPLVRPLLERLRDIPLHPPRIPVVSNVTGTWLTDEDAVRPEYWAAQMRQPVRLDDGFRALAERLSRPALLEVGPGRTLCGLARQRPDPVTALPSLPDPGCEPPEQAAALATLGRLWLAGVAVDWAALSKGERRHRIPLPTYPFERQRFWLEGAPEFRTDIRGDGTRWPADRATIGPGQGPDCRARGHGSVTPPEPAVTGDPEAARTPVEAAVISIWQAVLGLARVGVRDNFYDLGGHSVLIPNVMARLGALFQLDLPVLTLVEAPTVERLADRIEDVFRIRGEATGHRVPAQRRQG